VRRAAVELILEFFAQADDGVAVFRVFGQRLESRADRRHLALLFMEPVVDLRRQLQLQQGAGLRVEQDGGAGVDRVLALLPKALVVLTFPPQILVGVGLALVLSALTETALHGRAPPAVHGGWTISSRHAGVVIGLLALTPIFTHDIAEQRQDAIDAGTAVLLDSKASPLLKLQLAAKIDDRLHEEKGKVPTIGPAFEPLPEDPEDRAAVVGLREELQDQLDRGATHAFSPSFGLGALMALLALVPIGLARGREVEL
jgi:hypothetical protein